MVDTRFATAVVQSAFVLGTDVRRTMTTISAAIMGNSRTIIPGKVMKIIGTPASARKAAGRNWTSKFTPVIVV
jgi:hypothetical protein